MGQLSKGQDGAQNLIEKEMNERQNQFNNLFLRLEQIFKRHDTDYNRINGLIQNFFSNFSQKFEKRNIENENEQRQYVIEAKEYLFLESLNLDFKNLIKEIGKHVNLDFDKILSRFTLNEE